MMMYSLGHVNCEISVTLYGYAIGVEYFVRITNINDGISVKSSARVIALRLWCVHANEVIFMS